MGTDLFGELIEEPTAGPMAKEFMHAPFSVLNAQAGAWQERKRAWIALGLRGDVTRSCRPSGGKNNRPIGESGKGAYQGGDAWRGGTGTTSALAGRQSGMLKFSETCKDVGSLQCDSGTSLFDPVLAELLVSWFCPPAGSVLDPFAGGSVRGIVSAALGRRYLGIDIRAEQVDANREQCGPLDLDGAAEWIVGDCLEAIPALASDAIFDFVLSCPPYGDLEVYSELEGDISSLDWPAFLDAYRAAIAATVGRLAPDRFAAFVVGDFRDRKTGLYRCFPSETILAFQDAGAHLYNEAILVTPAGSLPIRCGAQFRVGRKLGKTHQNVLVFVKGDGRRAADECNRGLARSGRARQC
ncbi:MAG TPA: DNA methyltransferase [Thermoguttaceae bacterium]|nr:DNA methyltransferase [Thermoguttaceae bacterium]